MADRVVSIKLVADASGVVRGFAAAQDAAAETGKKIADSARSNRDEWATVGKGLTAVGVAITGVGAAALKTGIDYNTLQQTTRASLTTMLGSAKAANEQMDKLDAFARASPFSKSVFIQAQQQMLAFGIEAKKVIPYLDSIQNAVAASGGSNDDIAGVAAVLAKIQSSAKITAEDLNMLGGRGINAAELIGSRMGKTGAQIRAEITKGTLDAGKALDALAEGMQAKYAGAAANVKNTFAGSLDRVKAAWRDFSAELAKPLVDPNGGGALIDLLNWTADAMRNFQKLPEPVKQTTSALTGVAGVGTLAAGSFMLILPKALELMDALKQLNVTAASTRTALSAAAPAGFAIALALAATAVLDSISDMREAKIKTDALTKSLKSAKDVSKDLQRGFSSSNPFSTFGVDALVAENNLRLLNTTVGKLRAQFESTTGGKLLSLSTLGLGRDLGQAKEQIEELDASLASLVAGGKSEAAAKGFDQFAAMAEKAGWSQREINEALPQYVAAQSEAIPVIETIATKYQETADRANQLQNQVMRLVDSINEFNGVGQSAEKANAKLQESFAKVQEYVQKAQEGAEGYSTSLDASTAAGARNRGMFADLATEFESTAEKQFALELKTLGATQATANFHQRLQDGRQKIYDNSLALSGNADAAQELTDNVLKIPDAKTVAVLLKGAQDAEEKLNNLARYRETEIGIRYKGETGTQLRANGGTIGFAGGGTIPGFAGGGRLSRADLARMGGGVNAGTVWGAGTSKSDSVPVRLSVGEEVIQEPYASMNRGLLKAINRGEYVHGQAQVQVVQAPSGRGGTTVNQYNTITQVERDPRLVARQLGRELKGAMA